MEAERVGFWQEREKRNQRRRGEEGERSHEGKPPSRRSRPAKEVDRGYNPCGCKGKKRRVLGLCKLREVDHPGQARSQKPLVGFLLIILRHTCPPLAS